MELSDKAMIEIIRSSTLQENELIYKHAEEELVSILKELSEDYEIPPFPKYATTFEEALQDYEKVVWSKGLRSSYEVYLYSEPNLHTPRSVLVPYWLFEDQKLWKAERAGVKSAQTENGHYLPRALSEWYLDTPIETRFEEVADLGYTVGPLQGYKIFVNETYEENDPNWSEKGIIATPWSVAPEDKVPLMLKSMLDHTIENQEAKNNEG